MSEDPKHPNVISYKKLFFEGGDLKMPMSLTGSSTVKLGDMNVGQQELLYTQTVTPYYTSPGHTLRDKE